MKKSVFCGGVKGYGDLSSTILYASKFIFTSEDLRDITISSKSYFSSSATFLSALSTSPSAVTLP